MIVDKIRCKTKHATPCDLYLLFFLTLPFFLLSMYSIDFFTDVVSMSSSTWHAGQLATSMCAVHTRSYAPVIRPCVLHPPARGEQRRCAACTCHPPPAVVLRLPAALRARRLRSTVQQPACTLRVVLPSRFFFFLGGGAGFTLTIQHFSSSSALRRVRVVMTGRGPMCH